MSTKGGMARFHAIVSGNVQGVGYRYFTIWEAEKLGLTGYVRNVPDGTVEVIAEGDSEQLERLLERLRQGPLGAWVERVDVNWQPYQGEFNRFRVRY